MNAPPAEHIRIEQQKLHEFVSTAAQKVGLPDEKAERLAGLLTTNDLRGIFSHGTQQIATYAILMRDGKLNPDPQISLVKETPISALVDGDGGLGYFPAYEGTLRVLDKAEATGIAAMMTRNHGHFGAAGIYARLAVERGLVAYVTSGHQLHLEPGDSLYSAAGGSPMAFGAPTNEEPPLVLDFGAMHDFYGGELREELAERAPGLILRSIGLGEICQAWGGLLSGLSIDHQKPRWTWPGANQGSLVIALRPDLFTDAENFKAEMDEYVRRVRRLEPLKGFDATHMPGGIEAECEASYREEGIPMGEWHRERLEGVAGKLGIEVPW
jgi:LDH2 family malate/lactate/ureidoglycolate dehydrogenase